MRKLQESPSKEEELDIETAGSREFDDLPPLDSKRGRASSQPPLRRFEEVETEGGEISGYKMNERKGSVLVSS